MFDRSRIEVIALDSPNVIEWTGSVGDFDLSQLDDFELDRLMDQGFVVLGGGAQPLTCARFPFVDDEPNHMTGQYCECAECDEAEAERAVMSAYYAEKERERRS